MENSFGNAPMVVDQTTVGLAGTGAAVVPGSLETVMFNGSPSITIPAGGMVWSDPLDYTVEAQDDLMVSLYLQNATVTTLHDRAGRTNWFAPNGGGNHTLSESAAPFNETHGWSYIVGAIDVHNEDLAGTVVTYGSSVVDGNGSESCGPGCSEPNPYMRWTDIVSRRIQSELPADSQLAIVNAGIAGTTASPACGSGGIDGVSRLSRDVLELTGVTALIYYYGTNDLANLNNGSGCSAEALTSSMRATFAELRAAGIDVFVTPGDAAARLHVLPEPAAQRDQRVHPRGRGTARAPATGSSTSTPRCATRATPTSSARRTTSTGCTSTRWASRRWPRRCRWRRWSRPAPPSSRARHPRRPRSVSRTPTSSPPPAAPRRRTPSPTATCRTA
ncbi:hypothetical protein [Nocardioides sp. TF02-7]|uniref:hypothetical protein n=1 Tax=Nocardioides sp. TF02-7 TaxID=2917724 RepID=UPI001F0601DF|nr:hypothetical protein [Nocardioides sp. TF02-7]UMG92127.1 hypothetical protein MF408_19610 [Nocardioides sp. TF02-7]